MLAQFKARSGGFPAPGVLFPLLQGRQHSPQTLSGDAPPILVREGIMGIAAEYSLWS